ncbi:Flavin-dependent oxidoreductase, luciferase family (includes alkanesulfonate monooxygenase SsuD and methylene tetrahydromethanopterin reductase) [Quadrisphaera granulorum]|uniref:Alkanesulfonate monooxygenase SsuD/methylene tetrahydromethanopterin reductase-like flavin-dependent oxidoreductase (Luciferase family) n=1 Tax=Quadrisphaera granulorum TaxID=317664 RepID=A0A316AF49_9ACTN|nr:LLM class flavin-dependent oxidoreductase [Quadrisphaera granulorum]PWJ56416.1 alkanesulfonate monooxygenase SsuD/methylene tetrahydromethanopterin reductase-like flavin-dependent oxidoreductase (luciferase family) [Quadrisphaera granulorum]SZE95050.1 Flavin-dependent oxidoreductase, luciferase family (includes alkanesulfonate monooxygenase SsuD and methylene tetrahydromethanopterin reductase) [Quadrisphaera granulorum]
MKNIGFLNFGNWRPARGSHVRTGADALLQTVELAVAAEELGLDGAFIRVHHFAPQLSTPWPLLAAMAARTSRIELGTGVIDMRYEEPLAMAELAASTDLISGGRLQLGVSRGSPEPALRGAEAFGHIARDGQTDADLAREHTRRFRAAIAGAGVAPMDPQMTGRQGLLSVQPQAPGLADRIWWGAGTRSTARWAGQQGMNLMSSTLLTEDTGVPFDQLQAEQIAGFREAWTQAGWSGTPRVSVSRSVMPITTEEDRLYFGGDVDSTDQVGYLDGGLARFGRHYAGDPDVVAEQLARDVAVQEADTLLLTIPNMLGVEYNTRLLATIAEHVAPALGWKPAHLRTDQVPGQQPATV